MKSNHKLNTKLAWEEEFDNRFAPYRLNHEDMKSFIRQVEKEAVERERERIVKFVKSLERELPKTKCLNLENHLYGSCFQCEKNKGYNQALEDIINIIVK